MVEVSDVVLAPIGSVRRTQVGREATEPMREDIRLLGTILGDTVREQTGEEVFDLVERARVESFRVRRSEIDRAELAGLFDDIDIHQAIPVIRAFTHFALLANVAEDIHRERRRAAHVAAGEPPQNSSLAATYLKLDSAELDSGTVADALTGALVSPVITAHPTETRRRTVFDTQHRITELMRLRLHGHSQTEDGRVNANCAAILTLWQTALIRLSRLKIQDEIETGLRYYPAAFFEVIPQVNAEVRTALQARWPDALGALPSQAGGPPARGGLLDEPILRPGSWIGGDRDGNPNVTAEVVRLATGRAAYTALEH
jgi:phosphoenolpyruvate carboxylase